MSDPFIRSHIANISPYKPIIPLEILSSKLGIPVEDLVKLDANENPYGMPPTAVERLSQLKYGHIYPDPESRRLREKLSKLVNVPTKNIIVGAGADELIDLIVQLCMNPGDSIINCPPTFGFYDTVAQVHNLNRVEVKRNANFSLNIQGIQNAVQEGGKLLFLANPNNPDGSLVSISELMRILDLPILVVIDEAYIEFAPEGSSLIEKVLERDNLIVLRTFSKWAGLAGLRLGYGVFPVGLSQAIMKIKQPYNVSVAATEAGLGALEDLNVLNQRVVKILDERRRLFKMLQEFRWLKPYPSNANFILSRVLGYEAEKLSIDLANRGILIRYFRKPGLEDHVRFSIGKGEDTDQLVNALKELKP